MKYFFENTFLFNLIILPELVYISRAGCGSYKLKYFNPTNGDIFFCINHFPI